MDKKIENTKAQMRKGILEFCTLLVIARGSLYAADILDALKRADLLVVEGTLYPLLSRLKRDGLVNYEWQESFGGPPRKYYMLTPKGHELITELHTSWKSLTSTVHTLIQSYETSH